ncbi:MAG: hypothetical protein KGI54_04940 [Pseudomonadota bacterium]|nr:hypothetical protein [Pseudomonadota bacterium]
MKKTFLVLCLFSTSALATGVDGLFTIPAPSHPVAHATVTPVKTPFKPNPVPLEKALGQSPKHAVSHRVVRHEVIPPVRLIKVVVPKTVHKIIRQALPVKATPVPAQARASGLPVDPFTGVETSYEAKQRLLENAKIDTEILKEEIVQANLKKSLEQAEHPVPVHPQIRKSEIEAEIRNAIRKSHEIKVRALPAQAVVQQASQPVMGARITGDISFGMDQYHLVQIGNQSRLVKGSANNINTSMVSSVHISDPQSPPTSSHGQVNEAPRFVPAGITVPNETQLTVPPNIPAMPPIP